MVTILKNTAKLVTDVPFPALTFCSSGLHMTNVEKKLIEDFENWRVEKNRSETKKEAIYKDTEEFMLTRFQIKPRKGKNSAREQPISILDILDTMVAPNVDAAVAANSVRENVIACQTSTEKREGDSDCAFSCLDPKFNISGRTCFHVSTAVANYTNAVTACQDMSAELATISTQAEEELVWNLMLNVGIANDTLIGLNDIEKENTFVWQNSSIEISYQNWFVGRRHREPNGDGDCVIKPGPNSKYRRAGMTGAWLDTPCQWAGNYACSRAAEEICDPSGALEDMMQRGTCRQTDDSSQDVTPILPGIDIFLNPAKEQRKETIIHKKKKIAKDFFANSDMRTLFPELFRILWKSTLPCFKEENEEEHMLLSCELAGLEVDCSNFFTRVPTDSGMCCALNVDDSLRPSEYQELVNSV